MALPLAERAFLRTPTIFTEGDRYLGSIVDDGEFLVSVVKDHVDDSTTLTDITDREKADESSESLTTDLLAWVIPAAVSEANLVNRLRPWLFRFVDYQRIGTESYYAEKFDENRDSPLLQFCAEHFHASVHTHDGAGPFQISTAVTGAEADAPVYRHSQNVEWEYMVDWCH